MHKDLEAQTQRPQQCLGISTSKNQTKAKHLLYDYIWNHLISIVFALKQTEISHHSSRKKNVPENSAWLKCMHFSLNMKDLGLPRVKYEINPILQGI